jgi:hypothetical protein
MRVMRVGPSYKKRPASERRVCGCRGGVSDPPSYQKSNVNDTFISRGATTAAGASQVV